MSTGVNDAVLLDGQFDAALEVVLLCALGQALDQSGLVLAGNEVDADRFTEGVLDLLAQFIDVTAGIDGVFDLFLADD